MSTITLAPPADLYRLAATTYGDATLWTRIALANGLTDPLITEILTITLPDSGGVPSNGGILVPNS